MFEMYEICVETGGDQQKQTEEHGENDPPAAPCLLELVAYQARKDAHCAGTEGTGVLSGLATGTPVSWM